MRAPERTLLAAAAALLLAGPLAAQSAAPPASGTPAARPALDEADLYRREVFVYQAGGRPDPFRPLLTGDDMGVKVADLRLVGIIHSPNPRASLAIFTLPSDSTRQRLRVGQRLGAVTVVAIHPGRVEVREDALGVSRTYSLEMQRGRPAGSGASSPAPAAPAQPAPRP
jgi:hypothetical protein